MQSTKIPGQRRRTDFKGLESLKNTEKPENDKNKFYEVDLSDEDEKKEKKTIMNARKHRNTKGSKENHNAEK